MKDLVLATSIVVFAGACSDEADIGLDSEPVQCSPNGFATVAGRVTDPFAPTRHYDFDAATPTAQQFTGGSAQLRLDSATDTQQSFLSLRFSFYCGPAEIATYGVVGDTQQGLESPFEVASAVLGSIEYLPAASGVMIVDETSNCLAGRFRADFGQYGEIGGAFSAPWSPAQ